MCVWIVFKIWLTTVRDQFCKCEISYSPLCIDIGSTHGLILSDFKPPLEYTPRTNAIFSIIVIRTQLPKPDILAYTNLYYAGHGFVEKTRPTSLTGFAKQAFYFHGSETQQPVTYQKKYEMWMCISMKKTTLWSAQQQTVEQTIEVSAIALLVT